MVQCESAKTYELCAGIDCTPKFRDANLTETAASRITKADCIVNLNYFIPFIGEIGSYSSMLEIIKDGTIEFVRNTYTIWQNSAQLPYNALIVAIEETLHIALRAHTEEAIRNEVKNSAAPEKNDVERVVERWVAVEEALVGGLVNVFFPKIASRYFDHFPSVEIERGLESKLRIKKYRHLLEGIRVIENTGHLAAVEIYKRNPNKIKEMLRRFANIVDPAPS